MTIGTGRRGDQQLPVANDQPYVQSIMQDELSVIEAQGGELAVDIARLRESLEERRKLGEERYKVPGLQPHNGRDLLRDALEEALDCAVYSRAWAIETGDTSDMDSYQAILAEALYLRKRMADRDESTVPCPGCGKPLPPGESNVPVVCSMVCSNKLSTAWRLSLRDADGKS